MADSNFFPSYADQRDCARGLLYHPLDAFHSQIVPQPVAFRDTTSFTSPDFYTTEITQYGVFLRCNLCNVTCTGQISFNQHLSGAQHRKHFRPSSELSCQTCNLNFTDAHQQEAHMKGARHARRLKALGLNPVTSNEMTHEMQPESLSYYGTSDLNQASQSQLRDNVSGRKQQKPSDQQANLRTVVSQSQSFSSSNNSASVSIDTPSPQSASQRVRTKEQSIQTDSDHVFDQVRELESRVDPISLSLAACNLKERQAAKLPIDPKCQQSPKSLSGNSVSSSSTREAFCTHDSCIIIRALQTSGFRCFNNAIDRPAIKGNTSDAGGGRLLFDCP
ncbi:hypothetical protein FBUS_04694 [Fasciolopsis buskii]|uniref:C2H2-type domain-containing protein n=1 Tax=Fasciolopsis buskii TaxID=27845 RepID=A0A8E0RQS1_9TREM|nr:hypothetical protein FBUS_04694 [Fasciolopsis buski]